MAVVFTLNVTSTQAAPVVEKNIEQAPRSVESSWTTADFLNARPADPSPPSGAAFDLPRFPDASVSADAGDFYPENVSQLPQSLHGKVFFRMGGVGYACSGTLVESKNANSIFTAGHCVYDPATRRWATDFVFVPGYENGAEPYGRYAATSLSSTKGWTESSDFSYDIATATLAGTPTSDLGGAEKIAFDLKAEGRKYTIYGYPGEPDPPYDGERLVGCRAAVVTRDKGVPQPIGAYPCDMSHGVSGGGWMTDGYLNAVFSYVYCDSLPDRCGYAYASYFSNAAKSLYESESVGGAIRPTVQVKFSPPRLVKKRKVLFKFSGKASTPLRYICKYDQRRFVDCGARTTISRLSPGKHVLKVRSVDQTGQKSERTITRKFRVSLKR